MSNELNEDLAISMIRTVAIALAGPVLVELPDREDRVVAFQALNSVNTSFKKVFAGMETKNSSFAKGVAAALAYYEGFAAGLDPDGSFRER